MTDIKKSKIRIRPEAPDATSLPTMMLALAAGEAIGQRKDQRNPGEDHSAAQYSMAHPNGRRKATRYLFDSATVIRWLGIDEQIHQAFGIVRDISTSGVFVESEARLCMDANVELEIVMPGQHPHTFGPDLKFEGKVVRAVSQQERQGFAIAGSLYIPRLTDL